MRKYYKISGLLPLLVLLVSFQAYSQVKPVIRERVISKDGKPTLIKLAKSRTVPLYEAGEILKEQLALPAANELKMVTTTTDDLGMVHQKFQQYYKGIKVEYATYSAHGHGNNLQLMNGEVRDVENLNTNPTLSADAALQMARQFVGAKKYMWEDPEQELWAKKITGDAKASFYPKGELVIVDNYLTTDRDKYRQPTLAYKLNVYAMEPLSREYIYVDAHTGEIINRVPIIKHAAATGTAATRYSGSQTISTDSNAGAFRLRDYTRGQGIETYDMNTGTNYNNAVDFVDNDNNWTAAEWNNAAKDNAALDAHWGAQMTYDYFMSVHNRNSFDGNGAIIKSYVHYSSNYENAFWNGSVMTYGDGNTRFDALTSLDVVAHEIGHGITENTANLVYEKESGALNEAFSDIWGASVEYFAAPGKSTWLIGEDIDLQQAALRSMSDPKSQGQPDTYQGTNWYDVNGCTPSQSNNYCGVHTNSGVLNHWFYILSVGKSGTNDLGTAYNVSGLSITTAAKIAYRALNVYLGANTTYNDARNFTIQAAEDLYGAGSNEVIQATNAWNAVGLGAKYGQVAYCASNGQTTTDEYIGRVQLNTLDNATGASAGGYGDFTNISTDLDINSAYTITITPTWTGTVYNEGYAVWIDYNADGDFADAGELVYSRAASKATPVSGSFTVPSGAKAGTTRMRVSMKYNAIPTACESFRWGEVEDYTVNITTGTPPVCDVPTGLAANSVTYNSATLTWTAVASAVSYDVQWRATGATTWTTTNTTTANLDLTGLSEQTTYEYQVRTNCSFGSSAYSAPANFTTTAAPVCDVPTGLNTTNITYNSATLNWTGSANGQNYNARYRAVGTTTWTTSNTTATSLNISGLSAATDYEFQVNTVCSFGTSAYSASSTFTTNPLPPCNTPTGLSSGSVTESSATLSWSAVTDAASYDVQYRPTGTTTWSSANTTATSITISGLTASTTYEYQVRTNCTFGTSSAYSASATFTTLAVTITYCSASGNNQNYEYIDLVQLGSINNVTGANGGYGDFTAQSTTLVTGSTNTISFSAGFPGSSYNENWKIWIDFNHDGDFADAGENIVTGSTSNAATSSASFTVPAGAALGATRMRVVMAWNTTPPSCGTFTYGEVEDYTVVISATALNSFAGFSNTNNGEEINPDLWSLSLQTYPNPVTYELNFNFNEFKEVNDIKVYDLNGVEMSSFSANKTFNTVDVSQLANGVYILFVDTERGKFETRFIKQ